MREEKRISRRRFVSKGALLGAGALAGSGLLAACGDATPTPAASNTGATTTTAATSGQVGSQKVEVRHWDFWVTQGPWVDNEISLFQAANPGITIKKTTNDTNNYADLLALAIKGETAPDVFHVPQKPSFPELVSANQLAPLNQFPDFKDFVSRFPDPTLNFAEGTNTVGGKTYSAPFGNVGSGMWIQLWVNTKVFKDAGIVDSQGNAKLPQTADDILAAARQIKEKSGGKVYGYGFSLKASNIPGWQFYLGQLSGGDPIGGGLNFKTGKYEYSTNPAYKGAVDLLLKMRDEGLIVPDSASLDDEAMRVLFAQHKFGMMINGDWVINGWQKTNPDFKEYTLTHVPYIGAAEPKSYFYVSPGGNEFSINAKSKNLNAAWLWYKWLYSKEAGERWVKSHNGGSIFPQANKSEYLDIEALRQENDLSPKLTRVGPVPSLRNPEVNKIKVSSVKPDETAIVVGLYTGQLTDVQEALKNLDDAKQKALEQAISDAKAAGANVSLNDYIFSDWDPTQNYVSKPNK